MQRQLEKAWAKMELNSCYGFPPISTLFVYDKEKAEKITKSGENYLKIILKK